MRVSVLSYKMPELTGTKYGCFSKLPRHSPDEGRRYFETTYYASFNKRWDQMRFHPKTTKMLINDGKYSGTMSNWEPTDRIKITTQLISEKYNKGEEPKYNTECQRTWIYHRDPAVRAVEDLKIDNTRVTPLPKIDNELSLTMYNNREYERVRSKSFYGCPKKFTDVTKTTFHCTNLRKY